MPELPEVETMRRGILRIRGSRLVAVERARCRFKAIRVHPRIDTFRRRTVGHRVVAIDRLGKRVLVGLDNGEAIVFEPRMTGLVLVTDPPDLQHLRFRVGLADGPIDEVLFWDRRGLGSVQLLTATELATYAAHSIGPDALVVSAEALQQRLTNSRREIKVALLDQRAVAGIGNLYASEILHVAGIHPQKLCQQVSDLEWQKIHAAVIGVLTEAIRYEGSTLGDGTYRNALNQAGTYQNQHRVYDRAGAKCPTCGQGTVKRIVQAQRSTFFCPRCQTQRRSRRR